jgi:hypothetical protein
MSYRIEYQWACLEISADIAMGLQEPHYVVAIEGGDNNLTTRDRNGRERRVRDWEIGMIGTRSQVMTQAAYYGQACDTARPAPTWLGSGGCWPTRFVASV